MGLHAAIIRVGPLIHEGKQRYKPYIVGDARMVSLLNITSSLCDAPPPPSLWKILATPPVRPHTARNRRWWALLQHLKIFHIYTAVASIFIYRNNRTDSTKKTKKLFPTWNPVWQFLQLKLCLFNLNLSMEPVKNFFLQIQIKSCVTLFEWYVHE